MIYSSPKFFPGGDRYIEVELGDEMSFEPNFLVHTVSAAIRAAEIDGVIELIPEMASLQVSYDPDRISYEDVVSEVTRLQGYAGSTDELELESRIFYVPMLYFDPWTGACVNDYRAKVADKVQDPELLCELNHLAGRAELKRVHSGTEYWVAALGFWPGLCSLMPLDPRHRLNAPKYNPPRTWTPKGTIGHGGAITCIYPDQRQAAIRSSPARRCRSGTGSSGSPPLRTALRYSGRATGYASFRSTAPNGTRSMRK